MAAQQRHDWEVRIGQRRIFGRGLERRLLGDVFHHCMSVSWGRLLLYFLLYAGLVNTAFALAFFAVDGSVAGPRTPGFWDIFFFTWQLLGSVSFGGWLPGSLYGHALATLEIMVGVGSTAVMTGLVFARFTRPQAHILFARHPVVGVREGKPTLMLRVANSRHNFLSDAMAKVWLVLDDPATHARRFHRLALVQDDSPLFALSWSLFHVIDETSPLYGVDAEVMASRRGLLVAIVSGYDENYGQEVRARHQWEPDSIRWQHRYVDIFNHSAPGVEHVDFTRFHDTEALARED